MNREQLTSRLKGEARRLGFAAVGVASATSLQPTRLLEWIEEGLHGEMSYMSRNVAKRLDPRLVLPGARSVVLVAASYSHSHLLPYDDPTKGVISRYASGVDYHESLLQRLRSLQAYLERIRPGVGLKAYVDTGPVMEKVWAQKAGLGWIGKNGNLISRTPRGSWLFLGVLLLDIELDLDSPASDHCGTCRRCLDACPTEAIVRPYVVDSRRCISYLTIELKSDIPQSLRPRMGNLVFGCDICQDVCPWNRKSELVGLAEFLPGPETERPNLTELASHTRQEFKSAFRGNPIRRAKWTGFMRNVAVAMGNSGKREMIPSLKGLLSSDEPLVRRHAAWALLELRDKEAFEIVRNWLSREKDEETRLEIGELLRRSPEESG